MTTPTAGPSRPYQPPRIAAPAAPNPDGVIRRTRRRPFIPPAPDADSAVVSRELLSRTKSAKPQLSRNRKLAGDLPDWEPLPPGEVLVRRGATQDGR